MAHEEICGLITILRDRYCTADKFARLISEYRGAVVIPAHNQLRYAGHHLLTALSEDGRATKEGEIREAISHCERAVYDAGAAGIISAVEAIHRFFEDYEGIVVREVVSESADIKKLASSAQDFLAHMRSEEHPSKSVESFTKMFCELRQAHDLLERNRDDLNTKIRLQIRSRRRFAIAIAVALLGIVVTLVVGLA